MSSSASITSILSRVGLGGVVARWSLHMIAPWSLVLSGGEQQRLGFARMLYHQPRYVIADEATAALDVELETTCMQAINEANITIIQAATRPSTQTHHQQRLHIQGDEQGGYQIAEIEQPRAEPEIETGAESETTTTTSNSTSTSTAQ